MGQDGEEADIHREHFSRGSEVQMSREQEAANIKVSEGENFSEDRKGVTATLSPPVLHPQELASQCHD